MEKWGWTKRAMWADEVLGVFWVGDEKVLSVSIGNAELQINYELGWEDYLKGDEWSDIVERAAGKLSDSSGKGTGKAGSKGKGKAKATGKGKSQW